DVGPKSCRELTFRNQLVLCRRSDEGRLILAVACFLVFEAFVADSNQLVGVMNLFGGLKERGCLTAQTTAVAMLLSCRHIVDDFLYWKFIFDLPSVTFCAWLLSPRFLRGFLLQ